LADNNIVTLDFIIVEDNIDATVVQADDVLTVNTSGAAYQWLDCTFKLGLRASVRKMKV